MKKQHLEKVPIETSDRKRNDTDLTMLHGNPEDSLIMGELFAFSKGLWRVKIIEGRDLLLPEQSILPASFFLPKFNRLDYAFSYLFHFWKACPFKSKFLKRKLILLAAKANKLLRTAPASESGLHLTFSISARKLEIIKKETLGPDVIAEQLYSSRIFRAILPEQSSPFMNALIGEIGLSSFHIYKSFDPRLPDYELVTNIEAKPWVNLTALLDVLIFWGLPTRWLSKSTGDPDIYQTSFRFWQFILKLSVILKIIRAGYGAAYKTRKWIRLQRNKLRLKKNERDLLWQSNAVESYQFWLDDFRQFYIGLVNKIQLLTLVMILPVQIANRIGYLQKYASYFRQKSLGTEYFFSFAALKAKMITRERFLRRFGHRGFYELDLGQPRFWEYKETEWQQLLKIKNLDHLYQFEETFTNSKKRIYGPFFFRNLIQLIHTRSWLRHQSMQLFWEFRKELLKFSQVKYGLDFDFSNYQAAQFLQLIEGQQGLLEPVPKERPSAWAMDLVFLEKGKRAIPLEIQVGKENKGISIFPGKLKAQVWKIDAGDLSNMKIPDYERVVLVTKSLDASWVPFIANVDAVLTFGGSLLSPVSIILREAQIPSIVNLPLALKLEEGEMVEIDARKGLVWPLDY